MRNEIKRQEISMPLKLGILFMPYIFGWLTLRNGYSRNVRIVSFVWMLIVAIIVGNNIAKNGNNSNSYPVAKTIVPSNIRQKQKPSMPIAQVQEMCTQLGMYAMAYGNSKYRHQSSGSLFANVNDEINGYPPNARENIKNTWLKMVAIVDRTKDAELMMYTDSRSAISLSGGCQRLWQQYGLIN
jgi:hypothetical protein